MKLAHIRDPICYMCAEFGTDSNLPTYAGGLGVLAGDTMFEAAEQDFPMIGIGLLYQGRAFIQRFSIEGWQYEEPTSFQPDTTTSIRPVTDGDSLLKIKMHFAGEDVFLKAYQQRLGDHTSLFFLSTDVEGNSEGWRDALAMDYCCGEEDQIRAQLVLGVGGVKLMQKLGIKPKLFHFQEGRPIFAHWEIIKEIMKSNKSNFKKALETVKNKIVYTNHTLVPDGNLMYDIGLVKKYAYEYAKEFGVDEEELLKPGILDKDPERFSITQYALNVSHKQNSVSKLHFSESKKHWPEYDWINITNAVSKSRWQTRELANPSLESQELWHLHAREKKTLARDVLRRSGFDYDPSRLILGWARRISGYKQLGSLFHDLNRLKLILTNTDRPVHLLIAGKAHHGDDWGKGHIQEVMHYMANELNSHALFIPNYDIALARKLIAGVDVWLNTPEFGKEASGTSGMKAIANGVLNCTVADGWASEVDWKGVGWVLDHTNLPNSFYEILEQKIVPSYYSRDENSLPNEWIQMMKKSIKLSDKYFTDRMLSEYQKKMYS